MIILFSVFASIAAVQPADVSQQTAFFCLLGQFDESKMQVVSPKPLTLNFLLPGHPLDVGGKAPVKTYDPSKLLGSEAFDYFNRDILPGSQGYMVTTHRLSADNGYMLTLEPKEEGRGKFKAVLGVKGSKFKLKYVGECFGPVAPIDEAEFDKASQE